jgi:hypothetical protein
MDQPLRWLTSEEIDTYHRDGALCARQVMPPEWIARMATAVDNLIAAPGKFGWQLSQ